MKYSVGERVYFKACDSPKVLDGEYACAGVHEYIINANKSTGFAILLLDFSFKH